MRFSIELGRYNITFFFFIINLKADIQKLRDIICCLHVLQKRQKRIKYEAGIYPPL